MSWERAASLPAKVTSSSLCQLPPEDKIAWASGESGSSWFCITVGAVEEVLVAGQLNWAKAGEGKSKKVKVKKKLKTMGRNFFIQF